MFCICIQSTARGKPNQDLRFDIPSVGLDTVKTMSGVKASVLAIEAGRTLIFDKSAMVAYADRVGISVLSWAG